MPEDSVHFGSQKLSAGTDPKIAPATMPKDEKPVVDQEEDGVDSAAGSYKKGWVVGAMYGAASGLFIGALGSFMDLGVGVYVTVGGLCVIGSLLSEMYFKELVGENDE